MLILILATSNFFGELPLTIYLSQVLAPKFLFFVLMSFYSRVSGLQMPFIIV